MKVYVILLWQNRLLRHQFRFFEIWEPEDVSNKEYLSAFQIVSDTKMCTLNKLARLRNYTNSPHLRKIVWNVKQFKICRTTFCQTYLYSKRNLDFC